MYAAQFPVRPAVWFLDGVDTLTEPLAEQALVSAQGQQRALDRFLAWCAHQNGCVYGTNTRTAKEKINALVARLDAEPLIGEDGSYFTGQHVVTSIGTALYSPRLWPPLADGLSMVERDGDPVGLLQLGGPMGPPDEDTGADRGPDTDADTGPGTVPADNAEASLVARELRGRPGPRQRQGRPRGRPRRRSPA